MYFEEIIFHHSEPSYSVSVEVLECCIIVVLELVLEYCWRFLECVGMFWCVGVFERVQD